MLLCAGFAGPAPSGSRGRPARSSRQRSPSAPSALRPHRDAADTVPRRRPRLGPGNRGLLLPSPRAFGAPAVGHRGSAPHARGVNDTVVPTPLGCLG